jgi:ABC-type polysaccharide/polyol phosphate export permease
MAALSTFSTSFGDTLVEGDVSSIPPEPPAALVYKHRVGYIESVRNVWAHREIIYRLAERDFRAQYKQASLGIMWALLSPVATLLVFMIIFSKVKTWGSEGQPYALFAFTGILCWSFFAGALNSGGTSLLSNKALMAKTQFPRECFPLETMGVSGLNTVLSWIPLILLFVIFGRAPKLTTLWIPMYMVIEIAFAAGICLAISSIIIQMRDLMQVLPLITTLGLFATPVIWPYSRIPTAYRIAGGHRVRLIGLHGQVYHHVVGGLTINLQMVYGFFNPVGPVIDGVRQTLLLGHAPDWNLAGVAALGAICYVAVGYRIFKRLEEHFADIA